MIISRTPLRISFAGGGSDLQAYYKYGYGAVTSTAINKYIYITVNEKFDDKIRVSYSKTEIVDEVDDIQHDLVREALRLLDVDGGIEITSIADIPSRGTGLGSSSAFTVGLLNALYAYKGTIKSADVLAKEACKIEIDICGEPIGKQDQYACAYGGVNHIRFNSNESVYVNPVVAKRDTISKLNDNLIMFYTGITRKSSEILTEQKSTTHDKQDILDNMVTLAEDLQTTIQENNLNEFGQILHENWLLKKSLVDKISNKCVNDMYDTAIEAGAIGGKLLGAGGGGFLLLYCEECNQDNVRRALDGFSETKFNLEPEGSKIIYVI